MNYIYRLLTVATFFSISLLGTMAAQTGFLETDLVVGHDGDTASNCSLTLTDANGIVHVARFCDPNLKNPWGVGTSSGSPFWVADNNAGKSTLYNTAGVAQSLVVSIPAPGDPLGSSGTPTGLVFNTASGQGAFKVSGVNRNNMPASAPAIFLFSTEDGTILGWNPGVNPPGFDPAKAGTYAIIAVDNSANPTAADGAVYKGLAIATDTTTTPSTTRLYVTNFRAGTVEVYNTSFAPDSSLPSDAFVDPTLQRGFAPFNIVPLNVGGATKLFVTYAVQDAAKHDDVAGQGRGIVDTFDVSGGSLHRFAQHGQLNSPWGVALAPASFGQFGGDVLIGNFGNGHIDVYNPNSGEFLDKLRNAQGQAIVIDGLWTLRVGNGGNGGDAHTIYFTAGPNEEHDGLFGSLSPN
ncbi:MAG: TIGR03118 family protein [Terriglobales bacterium]